MIGMSWRINITWFACSVQFTTSTCGSPSSEPTSFRLYATVTHCSNFSFHCTPFVVEQVICAPYLHWIYVMSHFAAFDMLRWWRVNDSFYAVRDPLTFYPTYCHHPRHASKHLIWAGNWIPLNKINARGSILFHTNGYTVQTFTLQISALANFSQTKSDITNSWLVNSQAILHTGNRMSIVYDAFAEKNHLKK